MVARRRVRVRCCIRLVRSFFVLVPMDRVCVGPAGRTTPIFAIVLTSNLHSCIPSGSLVDRAGVYGQGILGANR